MERVHILAYMPCTVTITVCKSRHNGNAEHLDMDLEVQTRLYFYELLKTNPHRDARVAAAGWENVPEAL
jgi:hypothetical protein